MSIRQQLIERFFRYVAVSSQSDIKATTLPSTPGQQRLAELLADELRGLGLDDVEIDDHSTVTARKRGTVPGAPRIGASSLSPTNFMKKKPPAAIMTMTSAAYLPEPLGKNEPLRRLSEGSLPGEMSGSPTFHAPR